MVFFSSQQAEYMLARNGFLLSSACKAERENTMGMKNFNEYGFDQRPEDVGRQSARDHQELRAISLGQPDYEGC